MGRAGPILALVNRLSRRPIGNVRLAGAEAKPEPVPLSPHVGCPGIDRPALPRFLALAALTAACRALARSHARLG